MEIEKIKRGPKPSPASNTLMYFLRVSQSLKDKIKALSPPEAREALEKAAEKKLSKKI